MNNLNNRPSHSPSSSSAGGAQSIAKPLPAAPPGGKYRILVIEDDPAITRLLQVNLTKASLDCHAAPDGESGLVAFEETDPHLVLLDLKLPGVDGHEVCAKIRESSTVPIIIMTGANTYEAQLQAFKFGADDYVSKPFVINLLMARAVAQLRRAYRYSTAESTVEAEEKTDAKVEHRAESKRREDVLSGLPSGWAGCEACNYMGPSSKFQRRDEGHGQSVMVCPHCQTARAIAYAIR